MLVHCALFNNIDSMRSGPASIGLNSEQARQRDNQSFAYLLPAFTVNSDYRASRLNIAVTGDFPDRTTVISAFHVPSMAGFALNR